MADYTFLTNHNDWEALAIDGEIHQQGHEVTAKDALEVAASHDGAIDSVSQRTFRISPTGYGGHLPPTIQAIEDSDDWEID